MAHDCAGRTACLAQLRAALSEMPALLSVLGQRLSALRDTALNREVAGDELPTAELSHDRFFEGAASLGKRAACAKTAARGWRYW